MKAKFRIRIGNRSTLSETLGGVKTDTIAVPERKELWGALVSAVPSEVNRTWRLSRSTFLCSLLR